MAVEAPLSHYKKQNKLIIMVVLIGMGLWFAYDGYKNQAFIDEHTVDGQPDPTLVFNQKSPPFFIGAGILIGIFLLVTKNKKIVADDNGLQICGKTIAYDSIEKINKANFDSKGYFVVTYKDAGGTEQDVKISDRSYDNIPAVLDCIVEKIS